MKHALSFLIFLAHCCLICSVAASEIGTGLSQKNIPLVKSATDQPTNSVEKAGAVQKTEVQTNPQENTLSNDTEDRLPALDLKPYKDQLEKIKKLQRDNLSLKLQNENNELRKKIGILNDSDSPDEITVLEIIRLSGKPSARVYSPGQGITLVRVGMLIHNRFKVTEIQADQVRVVDISDKTKKKITLKFYRGL